MRDPRFDDTPTWARQREASPKELDQARSQAREIAAGPAEFDRVSPVLEASHGRPVSFWHAFKAELIAAIREDPVRRRAWSDALAGEVEAEKQQFPPITRRSAEESEQAVARGAEDWRAENDPFAVWGHESSHLEPYYRDWLFRMLSQGNLLTRIDPERGLRVCDGMPFPGMMEGLLRWGYDIGEDRELIEELLIAAPPVLDEHGGWRPERSVAALLVVDLIVEHAQGLQGVIQRKVWGLSASGASDDAPAAAARQELQEIEAVELPAWMRRAFGLLLGRSDGRAIALGYLAYLVRRMHGERAQGKKGWLAQEQGLLALAGALVASGVTVRDVREAWARAEEIAREKERRAGARRMVQRADERRQRELVGEGARTLHGQGMSYILGALRMLGDEPGSTDDIEPMWSWFGELLEGRDPGLRLADRGDVSGIAPRLGALLARAPQPAAIFQRTYDRLEPQRRRAQHASRHGYDDRAPESVLLLRVGLHVSVYWYDRVKDTGDCDAPRRLAFAIYASARRLWLTTRRRSLDDTRRDLVPLCFAVLPRLYDGDQLAAALAEALPPIADHAGMLTEACWFLWKNGVELSRIVPLVRGAGADLEAALRDVHQWATLTGRKEDFPDRPRELAEALGLVLSEEETAPKSERAAAFRKDFLHHIPWGAALLRRLDEDGLGPVHLTPFEVGTTWLLQAPAPEALRDRFGLAPEVRILAVHGQVRGRDLRLALDEPRGAGEVDPDLIVVASDWPPIREKIRHVAGPWGQRVPWTPEVGAFTPLADALREHLPRFDLFNRRDPIHGRALVGRRDRIDDITARLLRGQAVAVVGLRKVGKSSLLQAVAARIDPVGAQGGMFGLRGRPVPDADAEALVVSFDIQGLIDRTLPGLCEQLARELRERLVSAGVREGLGVDPEGGPVDEGAALEGTGWMEELDRLLRVALDAQTRPIALMLDEYDLLFEGYDGEPGIPDVHRLFALLRSLSQATGRVSLAFAGRDPAFVRRPHLGGFTSPLLGWVEPTWLGPLRRDEADELLVRLGKRTGLDVGPATQEKAWEWTGGHPLLLREYGSSLFELAHAPPSRPRPAETDALCDEAIGVFYQRDGVQTICGEVRHLLEVRFPESLALLEALADAQPGEAPEVIRQHGGARGSAAATLAGFGLLEEPGAEPRVPELWRAYFKTFTPLAERSTRSGTGGE